MVLGKIRLLVAALWAGSLWAVGYLVAPTLFLTLDKSVAGSIAGSIFGAMALLSLGCGVAMGLLLWLGTPDWTAARRRGVLLLIVGMVMCSVVSHFGLQPMMAAARGASEAAAQARFGMLHGISQGIYLVQSVLAGYLLWKQ
jgi:hypothetical protein